MTNPTTDPTTPPRTTLLTIEGMTCGSCVHHVQQALADIEGVESVEIQFSRKRALILHESHVPLRELLEAVDTAGYSASEATS